jgi:hypothetical protein
MLTPDRECIVVDDSSRISHLVMKEKSDQVKTKCRKWLPRSDSYKASYGNITCAICRKV